MSTDPPRWHKGTLMNTTNKEDPYLLRMLEDLKVAENILRSDISNRRNPFRTDGDEQVESSQANVDRLHKLIQDYIAKEAV